MTGGCFNENLPQTQQTTGLFIDEASDCVMKQRICDAAPPAMSDMIRRRSDAVNKQKTCMGRYSFYLIVAQSVVMNELLYCKSRQASL